jgi:outer membrane biosynthesis protein TonB
MTDSNENKSYREVRENSYTDDHGNIHTSVTRSEETVDNSAANAQSYQTGYVSGRTSERNYQETLAQRDEENTNRGLLIGVVLAGLAALIGSAFWYFNQSSQTVDKDNTVAPTTSAPISTPSPIVIQTPAPQQTKIIERTKEVPVTVEKTKEVPVFIPVPEPNTTSAPTVKNGKTPDVSDTVPPAQQTTAPSNSTSNSSSNSSSSSNTSSTNPTTSDSSSSTTSQDTQNNQTPVTPNTNSTTDRSNAP